MEKVLLLCVGTFIHFLFYGPFSLSLFYGPVGMDVACLGPGSPFPPLHASLIVNDEQLGTTATGAGTEDQKYEGWHLSAAVGSLYQRERRILFLLLS